MLEKKFCTLKSIVHVNRLVGTCIEHIPKLTMWSKNVQTIYQKHANQYITFICIIVIV